ncbi:hypothetical protein B296_00028675 [Ensete ventricosum]|uniref:Uncharacterized protein n=1 Tax=Ensete ventricosum TaxID=4639 RepID=A0A426Z6Q2_ENSVE|nr:hypothetical protein B296_00028675 [Ensete ventricosum]
MHPINAARASYLRADLTWHVDRGKVKRTVPIVYALETPDRPHPDTSLHDDMGELVHTEGTEPCLLLDHPFRAMEDFYTDSVISVGEAIGNVPKDVQAMEDFYTDSVITSSRGIHRTPSTSKAINTKWTIGILASQKPLLQNNEALRICCNLHGSSIWKYTDEHRKNSCEIQNKIADF